MRLAAIADLHYRADSEGMIRSLLEGVERQADVLLLAGDLTDTGLPHEMEVLLRDLKRLSFPIIAVLGNHDHESGRADELVAMLAGDGISILDATVIEIGEVGFVGTKGFCGGFDNLMVQPFGEDALKTFIRASIDEAVALENSATRLGRCPRKVAMLHYSPIKATLQGEPPELIPFLGSGRLANALDRQGVDVIVHGHAHYGSPNGRTRGGIPVYNVSRFVQQRAAGRAYCLFEV